MRKKGVIVVRGKIASIGSYFIMLSIVLLGLPLQVYAHIASVQTVGIATSGTLLWMNDQALDARMRDMQNLGATWIRVEFNWTMIQPTSPSAYSWSLYDRVVRVAGVHHLKVLATLDYTPKWAQEPRCACLMCTHIIF